MLSSARDWVWFAHNDMLTHSYDTLVARDFVLTQMIPKMLALQWPVEHVYDPVANTINIVFPRDALLQDTTIRDILRDAAFEEKTIPEHDWQGEQDLKEAILNGSNMNKRWH